MKTLPVQFVRSAVAPTDLPRDLVPQLALVGRSNVGKSTLINAITGSRVARTSAAAGKTRELNLYTVEYGHRQLRRLFLVDLPGYGYARGGDASAEMFAGLTSMYFGRPAPGTTSPGDGAGFGPTGALLIVDARHPGLAQDLHAWAWLSTQALAVAVVAAKIDKLSRTERVRSLRVWETSLNAPVTPVSAATGEGLESLWTLIVSLLSRSPSPELPDRTPPSHSSNSRRPTRPDPTAGGRTPS
ncbi:MAG: 50S ribosome-binding GTPase [Acidobacteria bacterium]|nr:50S ribosome-binding GTPase [Acidobacteriota bacterium]